VATYSVEFTEDAATALRKLDRAVARRILVRIDLLAENPYPAQSTQLVGRPGRRGVAGYVVTVNGRVASGSATTGSSTTSTATGSP
jgi:mRNA-degrading endonuclease RelE of RelBE toxin-antitoxin system